MRSAPGVRKFVGQYRDRPHFPWPVRFRMMQTAQVGRMERGLNEKPGTFTCEERISAPLVVAAEFAFRFRRVARRMKRV